MARPRNMAAAARQLVEVYGQQRVLAIADELEYMAEMYRAAQRQPRPRPALADVLDRNAVALREVVR